MKTIAVICNYALLPNRVGGMDRFFWMFDEKCKLEGIQIDWFFPNNTSQSEYSNFNIIPNQTETLEQNFLNYLTNSKINYDSIITHFVELCTSFSKQIKNHLPKCQLIAVDHNPRPLNGYSLKKKIQKTIKGQLYSKYTDLFIGVSEYTKKEILKDFGIHLKDKTKVIYNGIEFYKYIVRQERIHDNPKFLVACHLRESKGIQDLIVAVSLMDTFYKGKLKIDIYGDGPYKFELEQLIIINSLQNIFNFKGSVSNLYEIYSQYDYMLQPTHMECFSLSILESLVANVPVITTNVGGNEEVVKNEINGFIFKAKNTLQLKSIIENILDQKKIIELETQHEIVSLYSIDKMVENHMNLIRYKT